LPSFLPAPKDEPGALLEVTTLSAAFGAMPTLFLGAGGVFMTAFGIFGFFTDSRLAGFVLVFIVKLSLGMTISKKVQ
jgi:hypothetical protein